jgi:Zn2+/Cd2+-exporting ATPase
MATVRLKIHGMDCAEEVSVLRAEFARLDGIRDLAFDVLNGKMTVSFDEQHLSHDQIKSAIDRTGMSHEPWSEAGGGPVGRQMNWSRFGATVTSGALLAAGFGLHARQAGFLGSLTGASDSSFAVKVLYILAAICGAWFVVPKAIRSVTRWRPDMNLLMTVAVLGAFLIGEFLEAATVAYLFAVSIALESWTVSRARRAISALMSLTPETARIVGPDGRDSIVSVEGVPVGSTLVVLPGEKVPLDGIVSKGESMINQAPITGESMPVAKSQGNSVFAGTINQDGAIELVTSKPFADTTLSRIIRMVGDAQSKRSPSEKWVEKFAYYYTPAVMGLAIAISFIPPLFGGSWSHWIYQGLVFLVIGCPCALVISTPVSIVAALTTAARRGVLIKGGEFMEAPARLKAVAMDKTGTLTEGKPEVRAVFPLSGHTEAEVLEIAAAVELRSEHPLAKAVVRAAESAGIRPQPASNFQATKGKGATATIGNKEVWLGSHRLLEERGQETPDMHRQLEEMEQDGSSVIVVGKQEHVCGLISLADRIRSNAAQAVSALRSAGVQHVVMLTGDNRGTGEAIGRQAGIDEVRAELLPDDKVLAVGELVDRFGTVAMVGDGVNDAPAMGRASIGIAMGAAGTDAALETADIALMGDDLTALAWLIHHSRRTVSIIKQNIVLSLAVKSIFVVLALAGHSSLWAAILSDMGASLLVTANGLRLLNNRNTN